MKALSLWQPWADAIFREDGNGVPLKPDETRHWPIHIRGRIAIHASKKPLRQVFNEDPRIWYTMCACGMREHELALGAIIGTVEITDCIPTEAAMLLREDWQIVWGNYGPGRYAFVLRNPVRFSSPVPCVGRQGIFEWEPR